ncbi:MAG: hypothetical protein ABSB24_01225 [Gaiellaceae bacterium]|jgi:hypothetical protein
MGEGIHYVGTRYEELADLLEDWGYEVVPDPNFSQWQEIIQTSPLTGRVLVTGRRPDEDDARLVFKFEEFWVEGDIGDEAVLVREGASLRQYHYHGQTSTGAMRWCLDPERHPNDPCHLHPFPAPEDGPRVECDPVSPREALQEFERQFYLGTHGPSDEE